MNNKGLVDEIKESKKDYDFEGKSGFCYIMGKKIIKIYATEKTHGIFAPPDPNKICDFSNLVADTIVFPEQYIYDRGRIIGEISRYIKSQPIYKSFNGHVIIQRIIESYERVLADLRTYSNIDMQDLGITNILFSNKRGFHIIDTTDWQFKDNSLPLNIRNFDDSLIDGVTWYADVPFINQSEMVTYYNNLAKYGPAGQKLQNYKNMIKNRDIHFLEFLYAYMEVYRIHYAEEMKNLKDVKEMTKVLKKG